MSEFLWWAGPLMMTPVAILFLVVMSQLYWPVYHGGQRILPAEIEGLYAVGIGLFVYTIFRVRQVYRKEVVNGQ